LGPPTLKQTDTIRQQRSRDPDEFWHFQVGAAALAAAPERNGTALFPRYVESRGYSHRINARWRVNRARMVRSEQLLQIVRSLDQEMNNTSVILLFQVGKRKLLFPGDAQFENWQYALSQKKYLKPLRSVNLYKVGHHGSLNATPKSLWKLFKNKLERKTANRLLSLMSTMEGKHGSVYGHTEVPRTPPCARPSERVGPVYDATAQGQGLLARYRRELLTCGRRRLMTTSCGVAKPCCCRGTEEHEPPVGLEAVGLEVALRPSVALI